MIINQNLYFIEQSIQNKSLNPDQIKAIVERFIENNKSVLIFLEAVEEKGTTKATFIQIIIEKIMITIIKKIKIEITGKPLDLEWKFIKDSYEKMLSENSEFIIKGILDKKIIREKVEQFINNLSWLKFFDITPEEKELLIEEGINKISSAIIRERIKSNEFTDEPEEQTFIQEGRENQKRISQTFITNYSNRTLSH